MGEIIYISPWDFVYLLGIILNFPLSHSTNNQSAGVVKNPPASAGDTGSIPGPGRSHMPRSN